MRSQSDDRKDRMPSHPGTPNDPSKQKRLPTGVGPYITSLARPSWRRSHGLFLTAVHGTGQHCQAVAWGLSFPPSDIGQIFPPSEIDDVAAAPFVDLSGKFVSKDQV